MAHSSNEFYEVSKYEERYATGQYKTSYPETHIIRAYKQIVEWELKITSGKVMDFGCGAGANLSYFADQGFIPHGCDTSSTAISLAKKALPQFSENLVVTPPQPNLLKLFDESDFEIFISNQVLYYLEDSNIRKIVDQAFKLVKPGGCFIATMMAYSNYYGQYITCESGDFKRVEINTPRFKDTTLINFKEKDALTELFKPFRLLQLGFYSQIIRQDEGPTDHWMWVGIRD